MSLKRIHGDPQRNYREEWERWRRGRGWTRKEMASVLGLCEKTIENIETGMTRPKTTSRAKMEQLQKRYREVNQ